MDMILMDAFQSQSSAKEKELLHEKRIGR